MSAAACSICEEQSRIKLGGFYWRWIWPSGDYRGYRQLLDPTCAMNVLSKAKASYEAPDDCLKCGQPLSYPASVKVHGYAFLPGHDRKDFELAYCETCFVEEEPSFAKNARRLDDAPDQGGGTPALSRREDPWAAIGIEALT